MDRADYEADGRACPLSPLCQLVDEHGGECDPRTEAERFKALHRHLDLLESEGQRVAALRGPDDDGAEERFFAALHDMVEADAALAMRVTLAGGRVR